MSYTIESPQVAAINRRTRLFWKAWERNPAVLNELACWVMLGFKFTCSLFTAFGTALFFVGVLHSLVYGLGGATAVSIMIVVVCVGVLVFEALQHLLLEWIYYDKFILKIKDEVVVGAAKVIIGIEVALSVFGNIVHGVFGSGAGLVQNTTWYYVTALVSVAFCVMKVQASRFLGNADRRVAFFEKKNERVITEKSPVITESDMPKKAEGVEGKHKPDEISVARISFEEAAKARQYLKTIKNRAKEFYGGKGNWVIADLEETWEERAAIIHAFQKQIGEKLDSLIFPSEKDCNNFKEE